METFRRIFGINKGKPKTAEPAKYYGLENQGATCYLNSVLQVLFMTLDFRERVRSHTSNNPQTECIDRELSDLFIKLERNLASTNHITNKLKIISVHEQRDAAELYERILRLASPGASQIFHGELTNRTTCQKCAKVTTSAAGFWHLPLPLMDSSNEYSVERGVEAFFRPTEISGDDQMYCETCDKKCNAVLDCAVKHHPEVLVLLIKRFEFDYTQRTYRKISCVVDIPNILRIQNQTYELYGIVEHLNEQRFGRYIATIKSQYDGKWYTFDDSHVTVSRNQYFQKDYTEKSSSAYLLFYQRCTAMTYNGLMNIGATCYLNSILQVLFMTEEFKKSVTRHTRNNPETEHIDHELSDLFSELEQRCTYTYNIIKKLKINNVDEQRDAAEHYEKILRLTSEESSQIFHGELQHKNTCLKCKKQTESITRFWHLPLSLLDSQESYSVFTSIQDFFHREVQMYCVTCAEECDALLTCDLKHQPDVLVILLKRFEYDDRHMRNIKNNREVDVPYTLYMPQTYELYACVEHFGELRFGHYFSRIRSKDDGRWYIFDDMNILLNHNSFQEHPVERSQTAYLLFYRKEKGTFGDDNEPPASPPETAQDDAIADQNKEDNEAAPKTADMLLDETKINSDVIGIKEQAIHRRQEHSEDHHEEMIQKGLELHRNERCNLDMDRLTETFHKMTISDHEDSMLPQVDNNVMETDSDCHNTTSRMKDERFSENLMKEDEINLNGFTGDHRSHERFGNTYFNNTCFEAGEMYRLKLTIRQKDLDGQGKRAETMSGDYVQDQDEDFKRVQATKVFIRNEEQMKNEELCAIPHSGCRSLPSEVNNTQLNIEGSELGGSRGATSRDKRTERRGRGQSCKARFDDVESLGVTKEGDTEILRFKPKNRQGNEQDTDSRRMTGSSQGPETRHSTQV